MTEQHRKLAAEFFNAVWGLLDKEGRTKDEDLQMVHLAHASRAHWQMAGGVREWVIGEWQIARVYAALGRGEPAVYHGEAGLNLTAGGAVGGFLVGCAHEVMARACQAAGQQAEAAFHRAQAVEIAATLTDPEEREMLEQDLDMAR